MRRRITASLLALALTAFSTGAPVNVFAESEGVDVPAETEEASTEDVSEEDTEEVSEEDTEEVSEEDTEEVTEEDTEEVTEEDTEAATEEVVDADVEVADPEATEEEAEGAVMADEDFVPGHIDNELDLDSQFSNFSESQVASISESDSNYNGAYNTLAASYWSPWVTSVKDQNPYGTCWTFATAAASEASIKKEGLASNPDISEWAIAYYTYHTTVDPLGLTKGDTITNTDYLDFGGNESLSTMALASWKGAVLESNAKYSTVVSNRSATPGNIAFTKAAYHLENSAWISIEDKADVKNAIVNYGAVGCSYYYSATYYNASTAAQYCPNSRTSNHEVTIVGWDDNYSKSNFKNTPAGNGAWIIKNSWGTGWGKNGYFYLSYYDKSLAPLVYAYDYAKSNNYTNNYQYDGTVGFMGLNTRTNTCTMANVYTAKGAENLKAVGYFTDQPGIKTTVSIYKNPTAGKPNSGTLVATKTATDKYAGYHTMKLPSAVSLTAGTKFSVVIKLEDTTSSGNVFAFIEYKSSNKSNGATMTVTPTTAAGQSYYYTDSTWYDASTTWGACFRIKAFTSKEYTQEQYNNAKKFATRLYTKCLGRSPEAAGVDYWAKELASGRKTGAQAAYGFVFSDEYKAKKASDDNYIKMLYLTFMDRKYDSAGLKYWKDLLNNGLSREYVFKGYVTSKEFNTICTNYGIKAGTVTLKQNRDQNPNLTKFVNRIFVQVLGRKGDESGLNYWCGQVLAKKITPAAVAENFITSKEFTDKKLSNTAFVRVLYRTYLGREADSAGIDYWVKLLKSGTSRKSAAKAMAGTPEFKKIVASFGL